MLKRFPPMRSEPRALMRTYPPYPGVASLADVADLLAGTWPVVPYANSRNTIANGILAWAAQAGAHEFDVARKAVFGAEMAENAKDWARRFPDETTELGVLKQLVVLVEAARSLGHKTADGNTFYQAFGPDIPKVLAHLYGVMVQTKTPGGQ